MQKFSYHSLVKIIQKSTHDTATSTPNYSEVTTCKYIRVSSLMISKQFKVYNLYFKGQK